MKLFGSKKNDYGYGSKRKKPLWKRILKWTGLSLLLLLILIIIAPFIFKPQIVQIIKDEANNNVNAKIDFVDVHLSFLSTFPKFTLKLEGLTIEGKDEFEGVKLADIDELEAKLDLWSVVGGGKYEVEKVKLIKPKIHVMVTEDGKANYDIAIPDSAKTEPEEESKFEFKLKEYTIEDGTFIYDDKYYATYVELNNMNHTGSLGINGDVYDLSTETTLSALTLEYEDVAYINKAKTEMKADLEIDMADALILRFKENEIKLNNLKLFADGAFIMDDKGYKFDALKLSAARSSFADFLSMIPTPYAVDMGDVKTSGNMALDAMVNGYYADNELPGFDINFNIDNGMIQYPGVPGSISNLNINTKIVREDIGNDNMDNMVINVSRLAANFAGNSIDSKLLVQTPMSNPNLDAKLVANVDLATLKNVMPMAEGESYSGKIFSDVILKGRMNDIENEDYDKFVAKGQLLVEDMVYQSPDMPADVEVNKMDFEFSPQYLALNGLEAHIGDNDVSADGTIDNYMGYFFKDGLLHGTFNVFSNHLNADQFMTEGGESVAEEQPENTADDESEAGVIPIPANIDFTLKSQLNEIVYNGITIEDVQGLILVKDEVANLSNLSLRALGGQIVLNGTYGTQDITKPHIEMGYKLRNIDISQATAAFVTIEKLAPIAKYCKGSISSEFDFNGDLTSTMEPIYESLIGGGNLSSNSVTVAGFKPLEKVASALNMDKLANQTLNNLRMSFAFEDGKVEVAPFDVKMGKTSANVSGNTTFEQDLDYTMAMLIPKSEIPASAISAAEQAIGKANSLGLSLNQLPAQIPVNVLLKGKVQDPTVTTDLKEQLLELSGNLTDELKDKLKEEVEEKIEEVKEEVKEKVEEKVEDVKDDLKERRDKIMADAQVKADQVKAEGKNAADKVREEADKNYDSIIASAKNPIEKKAKEKLAEKAKKEAYEKADKIESEAALKADKIMSEAQTQADKLE